MTTLRPFQRLTLAAAVLALAGCATTPRGPQPPLQTAPVAPKPGTPAPAPATLSLPAEQRRLAELFRDTPVLIEMTAEGALRVVVPLKYSFDKGRAVVKPPLAAVLDRIAPSAKAPGMKTRVAAPADDGAAARLAQDRAASTRDYLVGKGVSPTSFGSVSASTAGATEILIGKM